MCNIICNIIYTNHLFQKLIEPTALTFGQQLCTRTRLLIIIAIAVVILVVVAVVLASVLSKY